MNLLLSIISQRRSPNYRAEVLADSPIAYWRLGESSGTTAADEIGAHHGTYVASPTLGVSGAVAGNTAVDFNGTSQYVNLGAPSEFDLTTGTYEAWINYATNPGALNSLLSRIANRINNFNAPALTIDTSGFARFILQAASESNYDILSAASLPKNAWTHVVAAWDTSIASLYVNGSLSASASIVGSQNIGANYSTIIAARRNPSSGNFERFLDASIDEVAIYGTALSAARVLAHYNAR